MAHGIRLFLRNSGYVVLGHATTTLFAFAYAVVLARVLGSEAYATLAFGLAWYLTFIALSYLGIDVILARGIGRERATAPRLSGSTLMLRLIAATVVAVVAVAIGVMVAPDDSLARSWSPSWASPSSAARSGCGASRSSPPSRTPGGGWSSTWPAGPSSSRSALPSSRSAGGASSRSA